MSLNNEEYVMTGEIDKTVLPELLVTSIAEVYETDVDPKKRRSIVQSSVGTFVNILYPDQAAYESGEFFVEMEHATAHNQLDKIELLRKGLEQYHQLDENYRERFFEATVVLAEFMDPTCSDAFKKDTDLVARMANYYGHTNTDKVVGGILRVHGFLEPRIAESHQPSNDTERLQKFKKASLRVGKHAAGLAVNVYSGAMSKISRR